MRITVLSLVAMFTFAGLGIAAELKRENLQAAAKYSAARRGLSMLVIQNGKVLLNESAEGSSASSPHKIYSGTKGFWVLAAMAAQEDGLLQLDERVSDTLAEWRQDPRKSRVTLRELLNFTSGLDAEFHLHSNQVPDRDGAALRVPLVAPAGQSFIYGPAALQVFHEVLKRKLEPTGSTPTRYLERKVLRPMGLSAQNYRPDRAGNPLLAAGFEMTAEQWSRMGRLILRGGAPVVSNRTLAQCLQGTRANPGFGMGFWNNRSANDPDAREFDIENMLELNRTQQNWRKTCLCKAAPPDLVASIGSGYQRLFVIPSLDLIVVRQGTNAPFSDAAFLRLLLGR